MFYVFLTCLTRATLPALIILIHFITLTTFEEALEVKETDKVIQ
jgi:hypothetical protein